MAGLHDLQYVRKPHGIPTTFGSQFSFLELCVEKQPHRFQQQCAVWGIDDEYGLLNRLDNDTAGLVYFAPTASARDRYKHTQADNHLWKRYICEVEGNVMCEKTVEKHSGAHLVHGVVPPKDFFLHEVETADAGHVLVLDMLPMAIQQSVAQASETLSGMVCDYPIMHHVQRDDRMQVVIQAMDKHMGRDRMHQVETMLLPISYDIQTQRTVCYAVIHQGIRHQIRAHCGALGYPIVGDMIYGRKKATAQKSSVLEDNDRGLHLWSIALVSGE